MSSFSRSRFRAENRDAWVRYLDLAFTDLVIIDNGDGYTKYIFSKKIYKKVPKVRFSHYLSSSI